MDDLISIIIPVYNSEEYLPECIDSIINQTYKDLQIILVDDCSKKAVADMCDSYAKKDNRIEVYHLKKNGGQSAARNEGLKQVKGDWITFADNDDTLEPEMLEILLENAKKHKVKVSGCAYNLIDGDNEKIINLINYKNGLNEPRDFIINALYKPGYAWVDVWSKIYHKSLIKELEFPSGKANEDFYVNLMLFYKLKNFAYTDKPMYNWTIRKTSQSKTMNFEKKKTIIDTGKEIVEFFKSTNNEEYINAANTFLYTMSVKLAYELAQSKSKSNIKLAKSYLPQIKELGKSIRTSKMFSLKSYMACKYRIWRVKIS